MRNPSFTLGEKFLYHSCNLTHAHVFYDNLWLAKSQVILS